MRLSWDENSSRNLPVIRWRRREKRREGKREKMQTQMLIMHQSTSQISKRREVRLESGCIALFFKSIYYIDIYYDIILFSIV